MTSAEGFPSGVLRSLRDMLDLEAGAFMKAITGLRHLILVIERIEDRTKPVGPEDKTNIIAPATDELITALAKVNARSALTSANRFKARLAAQDSFAYQEAHATLMDIESRFADHLADIKLIVLNEQEAGLFVPADQLLGSFDRPVEGFSRAYPNAALEIEEAAKCLALNRFTAGVFHCMRALEIGIKSMSKLLGVPDPTRPAEKNWGAILKAIKEKIDEKWPPNTRLQNSEGAKIEALYVTLDAIKNPWRNATMHVETVYLPHEALHIARCTGFFLLELMKHCDEDGIRPSDSPSNATVGDKPIDPHASGESS